ncbi:hypothetical protein N8083_00750 [Candidatus Pacebacteria bacterium]|nr:hypothetical protein [Candidatus Paceibacterota bacterium]
MINLRKIQPVLFGLLFMGGSGFVLIWMWTSIDNFGVSLQERRQTIVNEEAFDNQYNNLVSIVEATEDERQLLEQFVLRDDSDTIALLSQIDEIALNQGVKLETQELRVIEQEGSFDNLAASFEVSGREDAVIKIIKMFETLPYHGYVTTLSMQRSFDEITGQNNIKANVALLITIKKYDH